VINLALVGYVAAPFIIITEQKLGALVSFDRYYRLSDYRFFALSS